MKKRTNNKLAVIVTTSGNNIIVTAIDSLQKGMISYVSAGKKDGYWVRLTVTTNRKTKLRTRTYETKNADAAQALAVKWSFGY